MVENPNVGENLQDHPLVGISFEAHESVDTKDDLMRGIPDVIGKAMQEFQTKQFGSFTVGGNYSSALLPHSDFEGDLSSVLSSVTQNPLDAFGAELVKYVSSVLEGTEATGGYFTYPAQADFQGSGAETVSIDAKLPENYITICASLLHPLSRGSSHITSNKSAGAPGIRFPPDFNFDVNG